MLAHHVQLKVSSAQNLGDRALVDMFGGEPSEIRSALIEMEKTGQDYIHTEGCTNFDPVTNACLGCPPALSDIEVKAEVYKVIKAKQDLAVKDILKAVKEHLPDESEDRIRTAIGELL
jgi:hypothetical protein